MTAIRIGAVWSAPTWVRKAAMPARAAASRISITTITVLENSPP